jgi:hypothetical protein
MFRLIYSLRVGRKHWMQNRPITKLLPTHNNTEKSEHILMTNQQQDA